MGAALPCALGENEIGEVVVVVMPAHTFDLGISFESHPSVRTGAIDVHCQTFM